MVKDRGTTAHASDRGADDVVRTLELLWADPAGGDRPSRAGLSQDAVVSAAVELADRHGLEAVSMRAVAKALGVGTMSLYRHVPAKDDLLALMVDRVTSASVPTVAETDWRSDLRAVAIAEWEIIHRHPWILQVAHARVVAGPGALASFEAFLAAAARTGLPEPAVVSIVSAVLHLVAGAARTSVETREITQHTGTSDADWWQLQNTVLERMIDPERFPTLLRVLDAGALGDDNDDGEDPERTHRSEFLSALDLLLDGVEALVAHHR